MMYSHFIGICIIEMFNNLAVFLMDPPVIMLLPKVVEIDLINNNHRT